MVTLNPDLKEFLELLRKNNVKYLVIGGYAVNYYGYSRFTRDLDIWIWIDPENLSLLLHTIKEFGFESIGLKLEDFNDPKNVIQLGRAPNRIDLLVDVDGLDFNNCFKRKKVDTYQDVDINIISLDDLITAKKNAARLQDLADAEFLENMRDVKQK